MTQHFINLTGGLELLDYLKEKEVKSNIFFTRIQSTHLEQTLFERVIKDLDTNLLYFLSQGYDCAIYDSGSRASDGCPRTIWQGIPWIRFVLERFWFGDPKEAWVKDVHVTKYFERIVNDFESSTVKKITYFEKFLKADYINIRGIYQKANDPNHEKAEERIKAFNKTFFPK